MNWLKKYWSHYLLMLLFLVANWFMLSRDRVELYYSQGFYPYVSSSMRLIFGFLPFSIGDILYVLVIFVLLIKLIVFVKSSYLASNKLRFFAHTVIGILRLFVFAWLLFHVLWGFNYYRQPIVERFGLSTDSIRQVELADLARYGLVQTNLYAPGRKLDHHLRNPESLFLAYDSLAKNYPDLCLNNRSSKASLYGVIGNYMGYGGYYNPFTAEAQINDKMPSFLLPFIGLHEIAHQVGNAKESEANFIGYLAAMHSLDSTILYSANLELFLYAAKALKKTDSIAARYMIAELSPIAQQDIMLYEQFVRRYYGPVDSFVTAFYSGFLRINNQPDGIYSYNKGMLYVMRYLQKKGRINQPL